MIETTAGARNLEAFKEAVFREKEEVRGVEPVRATGEVWKTEDFWKGRGHRGPECGKRHQRERAQDLP